MYIVKELCRGLAYLHAFSGVQLIHRDVSPTDVMVSYSGAVQPTHFDLAICNLHIERPSTLIYGKLAYVAPERVQGGPIDHRSDQYAAAIAPGGPSCSTPRGRG